MSDARKDQLLHGEDTGNESIKKTDYKLLIDPQLRRGEEKLLRYNGEAYNTDNHGQGVVILRDPRPRMNRLWSRRERADLPVPRYKVDEWYIGAVPPREVTFSKLNDNVTKQFMEKMCSKYGKLERVRVYYHPKTQKHMGLSKVVFTSMKSAAECVKKLHMTSIMGNVIQVQIDSKGEILNKLFQRIVRGEMVAETIPDVIRHTQDGISMSNKYKERHAARRESRKSSQDDPRRRKSLDSRDKPHIHLNEESSSSQRGDRRNSQQDDNEEKGNGAILSSLDEEDPINDDASVKQEVNSDSEESRRRSTDLEARISSLLHGDSKPMKLEPRQQNDSDFEQRPFQREEARNTGLNRNLSLDSMDSAVLGSSQSEEKLLNAAKVRQFVPEQKPAGVDHRKLSVSNSTSPSHMRTDHSLEESLNSPVEFNQTNNLVGVKTGYPRHDRSELSQERYSPRRFERSPPHFHDRSHHRRSPDFVPPPRERSYHSPRHSPEFGRERRWKQGFPGRPDFEHDRRHFMYENDDRNRRDFHYRRRDGSPQRRPVSPRSRRMRSPNNWHPPDHFSSHPLPPPHHRRSPPSRFDRRRSLTREASPPRFRRSRSPDNRQRMRKDYKYQRRTPSPDKGQDFDNGRRFSPRALGDSQSPKLTLDQRLKEMTGEPQIAQSSSAGRNRRRKKDQTREQDQSSVDMEISEGESDNEKSDRAMGSVSHDQQTDSNGMPPEHPQGLKKWNFDPAMWNGFGPRGHVPIDPGMWNPMHPNVFKGFENGPRPHGQFPVRFPQDRWPSQFHAGGAPPGMPPPPAFPFGPGGSFPLGQHIPFQEKLSCSGTSEDPQKLEDERVCGCVLDDVVQDLKAIVSRDLNRKVVETMAFKVYELWWDENSNKKSGGRLPLVASNPDLNSMSKKPASAIDKPVADDKSHVKKPNQSLLNAFDPLNWAKNSFEMDGFRIGLGLRSAISKMPSFRVKKRPRTPTPPREEEAEEIVKSKKARRRVGKENQTQVQRATKDKKYNRIAALDSGGEDQDDQSEGEQSDGESSSEQYSKRKIGVLDVDEVFSESSESDYESSSESEKSAEDESSDEESGSEEEEEDVANSDLPQDGDGKRSPCSISREASEQAVFNTVPVPDERTGVEAEKTMEAQSPAPTQSRRTSTDSDAANLSEDPNIATSLLSPTAQGVTPSSITPQQLRHIHPKKRHRLLSHDQYEPFAKVAAVQKPKDELSLITEKERVVLEALADMQRTPDRRSSQDSDNSMSSQVSHPEAKTPVKRILSDSSEAQPCSSPQEELDAVEALLSIKKSAPILSTTTPKKSPQIATPKAEGKAPLLPLTDRVKMAELAEEHNYSTPMYGSSRPHPTLDPVISQILEEHNYCQPTVDAMAASVQHQKDICSPRSLSALSSESVYNFLDEPSELISAAERVKLRHVKPEKKVTPKKHRKEIRKLKFDERSKAQDLIITYDMWCNGLDLEDMKFLREVYETYLEKSNCPSWVNDSHWVPHPVTAISAPAKQKRSRKSRDKSRSDEEPHITGSARTEGFYKMEDMVKLRQRRAMYGQGDSQTSIKVDNQTSSNASELTSGNQAPLDKNLGTREKRHFMRRIAAEVGSDAGDLLKYNQLMFRKKAVKFKKSSIHGWGLFAEEPIAADEMVIEYVGQVVRTLVAERREVNYTKLGIGSSYLFRIDCEHIIDATKCGNYARFMNHSCNPSCYAKVITVDTAKKIVIYSKGPIKKSEEITYDYKFPLEDNKVMCFCGAENCRRTLN